ncbi:conserved hypothetical protein [uncultured Alphaproteobacteria bacterium]|jgi:hypothetical protein|uniref:Uncharacterized protein n=1 Tax=uncultured Alphaproteobacteria bacterium TaxID=91750 RepID=A0A212JRS5_9PROT|nr:conserved hypothetical protein [uncultured Alphaproteobacteria bacterium]
MSEIVNLRQARKRKLRAEKDRQAEENRARFGRPKAERAHDAANADLARRRLEQMKLTPED